VVPGTTWPDAALPRMANAGAELVTTFALVCELQADRKRPSGHAMLAPLIDNLSGYGLAATLLE